MAGVEPAALHCGMVAFRLLCLIRGVFPGCSLLVCLCWGVGRMAGVEPAALHRGMVALYLLCFVRMSRHPCSPPLFFASCLLVWARGVGACLY